MPLGLRSLFYAMLWCGLILGGAQLSRADEPQPPLHASLNEQVMRIPVEAQPGVTLETTLMHPDGAGPFPLAIINHGASGASFGNRGKRYHLTNAAFYFLSRGYAVAMPMMRGFSTSSGELYQFGCDFAATGIAYARDIRAVIEYLVMIRASKPDA